MTGGAVRLGVGRSLSSAGSMMIELYAQRRGPLVTGLASAAAPATSKTAIPIQPEEPPPDDAAAGPLTGT